MKALLFGVAAAGLVAGAALAQTNTNNNTNSSTPNASQSAKSTAGGDTNQAVATTSANASTPAKGANSFTQGEADGRIASHGYSDITGLKLDQNGVWRGEAKKGGRQVAVWLDFKGNVGQSQP